MNENVDGMMIRLVGLALAVLMMAGMTIYTDLQLSRQVLQKSLRQRLTKSASAYPVMQRMQKMCIRDRVEEK